MTCAKQRRPGHQPLVYRLKKKYFWKSETRKELDTTWFDRYQAVFLTFFSLTLFLLELQLDKWGN